MADDQALDPFEPTPEDAHLAGVRAVLAGLGLVPVAGSFAGAALEMLESPAERQHARAIRTLFRLIRELEAHVTEGDWRNAIGTDEFDGAYLRSLAAAQLAQSEAKREFMWLALINGYVRTGGDPERDRFLRLIEKYDVEHVQALARLKKLAPTDPSWPDVETKMLPAIGGERFAAYAYVQEFDADGLVRLYFQPRLREERAGGPGYLPYSVQSDAIALWTPRADRFLAFVRDPREMTSADADDVTSG
jgi:hypothetical protein